MGEKQQETVKATRKRKPTSMQRINDNLISRGIPTRGPSKKTIENGVTRPVYVGVLAGAEVLAAEAAGHEERRRLHPGEVPGVGPPRRRGAANGGARPAHGAGRDRRRRPGGAALLAPLLRRRRHGRHAGRPAHQQAPLPLPEHLA